METKKSFLSFRECGSGQFQSFALEIVPPNRCQLHCKNCYQTKTFSDTFSQKGNMNIAFIRNVLSQAKDCGFSEAVLIGGEPTLHKDLPEIIQIAIECGLLPIVVTNGLKLANKKYADLLTSFKMTLVLHALLPAKIQDEEVQLWGYNHSLAQAYKNIIGKSNIQIVAETVAIKEFLPYIPQMYSWCLDNGIIPFVELNRRNNEGLNYEGTITPEEVKILFEKLATIDPHPPEVLVPPAFGQPCTMSITGLHIKNFGADNYSGVYSCCAQWLEHGNLSIQSLSQILKTSSMSIFKEQDDWIWGPCKECLHYPICRGGCRGEATIVFGCPRASSPFCWHIPQTIRYKKEVMCPPTCKNCLLEDNCQSD